jgi:hypothetical protein
MDERAQQPTAPELPVQHPEAGDEPAVAQSGALDDPRVLTILTTEHWSLIASRGLVYNEAFARAGMFLSFLSASLVALALIANATGFGQEFLVIACVTLAFDLFIGLATLGRVSSASSEDMRFLQGMNRLRHAYIEIAPQVDRYFVSPSHDDFAGVLAVYGPPPSTVSPLMSALHAFTTTDGMIGMITAAVGGVLGGAIALTFGASGMVAVAVAVVAFVVLFVWIAWAGFRGFSAMEKGLEVRFPSPTRDGSART